MLNIAKSTFKKVLQIPCHQLGLLMDDPVRCVGYGFQGQVGDVLVQAVDEFVRQGDVVQGPDDQRGDVYGQHAAGEFYAGSAFVGGCGRAQGGGAVVVAAAGQAGGPDLAVLLFDGFGQPGVRAGGCAHVGEKLEQAAAVVFQQDALGIGADEEVHVRAGGLLFGVAFQLAPEGAGVRGVDDGELFHQMWQLVGHAPGDGTAPVVGDQAGQLAACLFV